MRFLHLILGISKLFVKMTTDNLPSCTNCIHFIPEKQTYFSKEKQCRKFIEADLITGVISHSEAKECRKKDSMCGPKGRLFEPKNSTTMTIIPDYYEEQMAKIKLGFFVSKAVFDVAFWLTIGETVLNH